MHRPPKRGELRGSLCRRETNAWDRCGSAVRGAARSVEEVPLGPHLTLHLRVNSHWILALHSKCTTIKITEERKGERLCDLGVGKDSLDKFQTHKGRIFRSSNLYFFNFKKFFSYCWHSFYVSFTELGLNVSRIKISVQRRTKIIEVDSGRDMCMISSQQQVNDQNIWTETEKWAKEAASMFRKGNSEV